MKSVAALLLMSGLIASSVLASQPTDLDGAKTPNGKVVVGYIETLFNQHKGVEAYDKYVSRDAYVSHGYLGAMGTPPPQAAGSAAPPAQPAFAQDGKSNFERMREAEARETAANPQMRMELKKVIVQGDLVFVQAHAWNGQTQNGDLMWILFRVKDGKITEDWDTHNPIPDDQVNKQF